MALPGTHGNSRAAQQGGIGSSLCDLASSLPASRVARLLQARAGGYHEDLGVFLALGSS